MKRKIQKAHMKTYNVDIELLKKYLNEPLKNFEIAEKLNLTVFQFSSLLKNLNLKRDPKINGQIRKRIFLEKYGVENIGQLKSVKEKKKQTYLKNYGVEHPLKSKEIQDKIKSTNLKKYGQEFALQNKDFHEKQKNTMIERYGVENAMKSNDLKEKQKTTNLEFYNQEYFFKTEQFKEKRKATNLKTYGYEFAIQNESVKEKQKNTNLSNFGVEHVLQNEAVKEKQKTTNLERYGFESPLLNEEIKNKTYQTMVEKFGVTYFAQSEEFKKLCKSKVYDNFSRFSNYVTPKFSKEEFIENGNNSFLNWKCEKCNSIFQHDYSQTSNILKNSCIPRCPSCYPINSKQYSKFEKEILEFVKSILKNEEVLENDRNLIHPFEIDILIPSKKVAIECNGDFWHSEMASTKIDYHLKKTTMCENKDFQLIHIFESEWIFKNEIVKSKIKNILGIFDKKIFARKCVIKEIDTKIKDDFLNQFHIQGKDYSNYKYGLFFNDELVSVMTFSEPRFDKNHDFELVRYASKYHVIGGAGKLLKYFERNFKPKSIVTYADRRFSKGNLYYKLNFSLSHTSSPNYWWVKNDIWLSRYMCQKHKLKKLLGECNFDEDLSENENMTKNGFFKIFDCGNYVFVKNF